MKTFNWLVLFGFLLGCAPDDSSWSNHQKVYEFVNGLFPEMNPSGTKSLILLQAESSSSWVEDYLKTLQDIQDLVVLDGLSSKKLDEVLTQEEWNRILNNSKDEFVLDSMLLDPHIHLIRKTELAKMLSSHPEKFEDIGLFDLANKYGSYYIISNPVFYRNGNFAFAYIRSGTLDLIDGSEGLIFYEHKNGLWKKVVVAAVVQSR